MGSGRELGLRNLKEDLTPQMGANLDWNGFDMETAFTAGSIIFADATGILVQDNANLFWDDSNNRLEVNGDLRLISDADEIQLGSVQDATISHDGSDLQINAQNVGTGGVQFTGPIGIETAPISTSHLILDLLGVDPIVSTVTNASFHRMRASASANTNATINGLRGEMRTEGTFNYTGGHSAVLAVNTVAGTGTVSLSQGVKSTVQIENTTAGIITEARAFTTNIDAEDGTITTAIGFKAINVAVDTGSVVNAYGAYLEKQTNGSVDNFSLISFGDMAIRANSQKFYLGATENYSTEWDGSDAVHTVTTGRFLFSGGFCAVTETTDTCVVLGGRISETRLGDIPTTDGFIVTTADGGTFPFNEFGNLVIGSRVSGSRNLVLTTDVTDFSQFVLLANGNTGNGSTAPDAPLEINRPTGGGIRLTYNDADGSATDYATIFTDSNGGLQIVTVDGDGAAGDIDFAADGVVTIGDGGTTNYAQISQTGDLTFVGSAGLSFGEISVKDNLTSDEVSTTKTQVLRFDTNGESNNTTPDHTNDHITIPTAGRYMVVASLAVSSADAQSIELDTSCWKNNGATELLNVHAHRSFPGGSTSIGSISLTGIHNFSANDTLEIWVEAQATRDIIIDDVTLTVYQLGG